MNNRFNPLTIISMIKNGANPEQVMLSYLEGQFQNTPMGSNLLSLAKQGKTAEIEKIARNITAQRGVNYDEAFSAFKKNMGLK